MADRRNVTASVSTTRFVEGSHLFKISGYSLLLESNSNASIQSTPFRVGGYRWAINYCPQYCYGPQSSVYVELLSEGVKVMARFKFYLLDRSGKYVAVKPHDHDHDHDRVLTFGDKGVEMGHDLFVKNSDMVPYLHGDDSFTIKCTLHVLTSSVEHVHERVCREEDPWKLSFDLGKLLDTGEGSDVAFDVKGELFRAHKCILAARSHYFHSQFFGPLRKPEPDVEVIKVENMEPTVVRALLQYIYTNSFPEMKQFDIDTAGAGAQQRSRYALIQSLISVADQYLIDHLKSICEELLRNEITDINVSAFLAIAEKHNCYSLKFACLDHLSDPGPLAMAMLTDEFSQLALDCPAVLNEIKEIIGHPTLERALSEFQESLGLVSDST